MSFSKYWTHLTTTRRYLHKLFPADALKRIEDAIAASEKKHRGEICFAVEAGLDPILAARGKTAKDRSVEVFSTLRVWDTEENTGVLIYLLLADRDFEIIADRGLYRKAGKDFFEEICREMENMFRDGQFEQGVQHGIRRLSSFLEENFPGNDTVDELPNRPVVL
jgi:uncharacterized membrane protein